MKNQQFKRKKGISGLCSALQNSFKGLKIVYRDEAAFRIELTIGIALTSAALFLSISAVDKALLIGSVMLVLITEVINSAIETAIDRISYEIHDLAGKAKDLGSAAVLLSIINCIIFWMLILS